MSNEFELSAEPRSDLGKGASRRLRRVGKVPAIIYGAHKDPTPVSLQHSEVLKRLENEAFYSHILTVNVGGTQERAVLRDMQRHPAKPIVMHMDLQRVVESERIHMLVPLHFVGEEVCVGVKVGGGRISHLLTSVDVSCLAKDLPEFLTVDLSQVEVGQSIHLSNLTLPPGVELVALAHGHGPEHDLPVATVLSGRAGVAEEGMEGAVGGEGMPAPEA